MLEPDKEVSQSLLHDQHLQLYNLVEQLDFAIEAGVAGECRLGSILLALEEYTQVHFGDEEKLMRIHGYHSLRAHRSDHNALTMKLIVTRQEFDVGKIDASISLAHYLHSWLTHHIEGWDRQFHQFLNARGLH